MTEINTTARMKIAIRVSKQIEVKEMSKPITKTGLILAVSLVLVGMTAVPAVVGTASAAIAIANCTELQNMKNDLSGDYYLANDIDCSDTVNWNAGAGFEPIGTLANGFTGTFDGQCHTIANLFINRSAAGYVALFGYTGSESELTNVGLGNISVSGHIDVGGLVGHNEYGTISNSSSAGSVSSSDNKVGGLVGYNKGTISNSYSTSRVNSNNNQIGGLAGINEGTINNSYSTGSVTGNVLIGGLVGNNFGTINNSYSTGSVTGNSWAGGLVGLNCGGTISNSYWDNETSGQSTSDGGEGRTTAEMKQQATFVDWNFDNIWTLKEDVTYPVHRWQPRLRPVTPFVVFGFVNHTSGNPLNDPNVTITDMGTGEVFTAETNESSNYYQVITSSWNVIAWDMLHFNATNSNSTEFDHSVTRDEINNGGFMQDIAIDNPDGPADLCGDVNDDGSVDMTDVMTLWYDIADYPYVDAYTISNAWAADVNCDDEIDMTDVMTLWYDIADYPHVGAYEVNCCE